MGQPQKQGDMRTIFYFSRKERRSICLFALFLVVVLLLVYLYGTFSEKDSQSVEVSKREEKEVNLFIKGVSEQKAKETFPRKKERVFHPSPFDPNTCDSVSLLNLGLREWQVHAFLRYRKAGARFYSEKDLRRVNSFTDDDIRRMLPFACFPVDKREQERQEYLRIKRYRDSVHQSRIKSYPQKLPAGTVININEADTVLLKQVPGIGSYYARKIVDYRNQLGGYVHAGQLLELGLTEKESAWFYVGDSKVRKIRINKDDFRTLARHPYMRFEGARIIARHRDKYGDITSLKQLSTEKYFEGKLDKLEPYIDFH